VTSRRALLVGAVTTLAAPLAARAQQSGKVHQIGYLIYGSPASVAHRTEALRTSLRHLGYVEGRNITIAFRSADMADRLPEVAADLVRLNVDVIFATSSTEVEAARRATKTIPIVFATHADPEGVGHVASLARPGGNITGLSMLLTELVVKELEIMKQALPHLKRIGVLLTSTAPSHRPAADALEAAAPKLGVQLFTMPVRTPEDLDAAFSMMARERVNGFLAVSSPLTRPQRARVAELALNHRLAGMFGTRENVEEGGLMSYAPDLVDLTPRRDLHRQDPQGGQASRPAGGASVQVPACHQPQDREGPRPHDSAGSAGAGG
jgi:putative tryptophan/tyrosine transport system substrate-binding protein